MLVYRLYMAIMLRRTFTNTYTDDPDQNENWLLHCSGRPLLVDPQHTNTRRLVLNLRCMWKYSVERKLLTSRWTTSWSGIRSSLDTIKNIDEVLSHGVTPHIWNIAQSIEAILGSGINLYQALIKTRKTTLIRPVFTAMLWTNLNFRNYWS
jgi:hypothetical protein